MRSPICNETSLLRWLLRGLLVAVPCFAACSGDEASPSGDTPGACTADVSSDPANCGSCGNACVIGEACVGGSCRVSCTPPQQDCGGVCADPASNALHCGGCNQPCGTGEICQNGSCETGSCPSGQELCSGACVDRQADPMNCGSCGNACLFGQSCQSGQCVGGSGTGGSGGGGTGGGGATGGNTNGGTSGSGMGGSGNGGTAGSGMGGSDNGGTSGGGSGGSGGNTDGECRVWMAPNGNDSNDGSEGSPVATLLRAYDLMCPKPPDGTENGAECLGPAPRSICAKPGTYMFSERLEFRKTRMGTANNRLILQGDPASSERPIFDFSSQERLSCGANPDNIGGITVNAHYVTIRNIVVREANDNCILVQGKDGLVENVLTYACADTGIQISAGGEYEGTGTNNTIRNCDSHSNYDEQCSGENADGFAIKEGTGTGNAFIGCRAWNNTDDGFDLYAWTSPVRIENSWAFDQCRTNEDDGSDCNGFKLGGDDVSASHQLRDLIAVGNSRGTGNGFTENSNPASLSCSGTCAAWGNRVDVDSVSGVSTSAIGNANVNNMAADSARNADGSLKAPSAL